jgi:iron-sulfur cluster repair protein YtfE (RIC family)
LTPQDHAGTGKPTCNHGLDAFGILRSCHDHILERMTVLEGVAEDLARTGAFSDAILARLCEVLAMLDTAVPLHSADEEQTLFPVLRELPPFKGTEGTPMDCMEGEHALHQGLMAVLKRSIMQKDASATCDAARLIVTEYRGHIEKENEILFPMAQQIVTNAATLDQMTAEMRERRRRAGLGSC